MALLEEILKRGGLGEPEPPMPLPSLPQTPTGLAQASGMPEIVPKAPPRDVKSAVKEFTSDLMFTLAQSFAAASSAPGQRGTLAGMAAAFAAPGQRQSLIAQQQAEQEKAQLAQLKTMQELEKSKLEMDKIRQEIKDLGVIQITRADGSKAFIKTDKLEYSPSGVAEISGPSTEEQRKQEEFEAKKQEEAAGVMIPGTEFINDKQERSAMFRVRQADGTYRNEVRVLGKMGAAPQAPVQTIPGRDVPLSPEVEAQRARLAAVGRSVNVTNEPLVPTLDAAGNAIYTPRSQAAGERVPSSSQNRPPSEGERSAFRFYERMSGAMRDLAGVEDSIKKLNLAGQTRLKLAPNFLQSETNQIYQQAQRAFTEARLRKDSGATVPESEYENDRRTYFVQPGDTAKVIEQKARSRETALAALRKSAGRAYEETYGEMPGKTQQEPTGQWKILSVK